MSIRGFASLRKARPTRSSWPRRGLERLEREDAISGYLTEFVPAPGQGALLIQARADDRMTLAACMSLRDEAAERCVMAERALAASLGATCTSPLGAAAVPAADDTALAAGRDRAHAVPASDTDVTLRGWVGLPDRLALDRRRDRRAGGARGRRARGADDQRRRAGVVGAGGAHGRRRASGRAGGGGPGMTVYLVGAGPRRPRADDRAGAGADRRRRRDRPRPPDPGQRARRRPRRCACDLRRQGGWWRAGPAAGDHAPAGALRTERGDGRAAEGRRPVRLRARR